MTVGKYFMLISLLIFIGCAEVVRTTGVKNVDTIPRTTYTIYLYALNVDKGLRAALLKSPDTEFEIVPYSKQISETTGTYEDAVAFMEKSRGYSRVITRSVTYKGGKIGYLLTHHRHIFSKSSIEVNLFEKDGKIYFSVWEKHLPFD